MTVAGHFERVAAVYESLRTTDEAPVRRIRQLLSDRPVTGLDIGCGTGRYSRLLPDGSLLVASDVSAAMLAELKPGGHGHALGVVPLLSAAEELPLRTASLRPRVSASTTSFPSHPAHLPVAGQRTCGSAR